MSDFRISRAAVLDMKNIALYTKKHWGREQQHSYLRLLDQSFHRLAKQPFLGKPCDSIRKGYRQYPQGKHVIFYRIAADGCVEIIRILHHAMSLSLHFET